MFPTSNSGLARCRRVAQWGRQGLAGTCIPKPAALSQPLLFAYGSCFAWEPRPSRDRGLVLRDGTPRLTSGYRGPGPKLRNSHTRTWNYIELSIPYLLLRIVVGNFGTNNVYRSDICFSTWRPSVHGAWMEEVTFDQRYDQIINKSWLFRTVSMVTPRNNWTLQLKQTVFSSFRSQR